MRLTIISITFIVIIAVLGNFFLRKNIHEISQKKKYSVTDCSKKQTAEKRKCWRDILRHTIRTESIQNAFALFKDLTTTEPVFAANCHDFAHSLGDAAYEKYKKGEDFPVTQQLSYCSYGFYHGFMERLLANTADYKKVRAFCTYINDHIEKEGIDLSTECYHGIGHGFVGQHETEENVNESILAKQSIELCRKIAISDRELKQCATGVFNGIGNLYLSGEFGLQIKKEDPLWLCREQPSDVKHECYGLLSRLYPSLLSSDFIDSFQTISASVEYEYLRTVISNIAALSINIYTPSSDYIKLIEACHSVNDELHYNCIEGSIQGILQSGLPEKEYVNGLMFCQTGSLTDSEKTGCYNNLFRYIDVIYTDAKIKTICASIEGKYQKTCFH